MSPLQFKGARLRLASWLETVGQANLASAVSVAETPDALQSYLGKVDDLFTSGLSKRDYFTHESSGLSVNSHPVARHAATSTITSFDDKLSTLSALYDQIHACREELAFNEEIKAFIAGDRSADDYEARLDAYILEGQGFLSGLKGDVLDVDNLDTLTTRARGVADANEHGARWFIGLIRSGTIGRIGCLNAEAKRIADVFLSGAPLIWNDIPKYMVTLSKYWARTNAYRLSADIDALSESMGRDVAGLTYRGLRLAFASRLPKSIMLKYLHLMDPEAFIYARGWLKGYVEHHISISAEDWVDILGSNIGSVVYESMNLKDALYMSRAAESCPGMVSSIDRGVARQREIGNKAVADVISGNRRTIVYQALISGKLGDFVEAAFESVPVMLMEMENEIRRLRGDGQEDIADILEKNRGSIISRAINSGKLEAYPRAVFGALPNIVQAVKDGITRLREQGSNAIAEAVDQYRGSIISCAVGSGRLDKYPGDVIRALPVMLQSFKSEIDKLRNAGRSDLADIIESNRGGAMNRAIQSGMLNGYLKAAFKAVPRMLKEINKEVVRLRRSKKYSLATAMERNQGTIICHAINSGMLETYSNAAIEDASTMLASIGGRILSLRQSGNDLFADIIESNQSSIMSRAFNNGGLDRYVRDAMEAVPTLDRAIDDEISNLRDSGSTELANIMKENRRNIISCALGGGMLGAYPTRAFKALPLIVEGIDEEIAKLRRDADHSSADVIDKYRNSIMAHALNSGTLERYPQAAAEATPANLKEIEDEIARHKKAGNHNIASFMERNRLVIIHHTLNFGRLHGYPKAVSNKLPSILKTIDDELAAHEKQGRAAIAARLRGYKNTIVSDAIATGLLDDPIGAFESRRQR